MNRTGWVVTAVAGTIMLLLGFTAGWFGNQAYLRAELASAFSEVEEDLAEELPEDMEAMEEYEEDMGGGDTGPLVVALGDTHDFGDGITLSVTDPYRFTEDDLCVEADNVPGCYGEPPIEFAGVTLTVDNASGAALDMLYVTVTCSVDNTSSEGGYYDELPSAPDVLPDGQSAEWVEACEMGADADRLQVTVAVDDREPVTFDGTVD